MRFKAFFIMILILLAAQFGAAQELIVVYEGAETSHNVDNHPGSEYLWEVYKSINPEIEADPLEFYFTGSKTTNMVDVHWIRPGLYYLKVNETDVSGCSNAKVIAVSVVSNNRSIGFAALTSSECYAQSNGFSLTLDVLDDTGQALAESYFPIEVSFGMNGVTYMQSISYDKQVLLIDANMFGVSSETDTKVTVEITHAEDNQNGGIQPSGNKLHTRTIFALPDIQFTSNLTEIIQGTTELHTVEMITGSSPSAKYSWLMEPANGTSTDLSVVESTSANIRWDGPLGLYSIMVSSIDGNGCFSDTIMQQVEIVAPNEIIVDAGNDTTIGSCNSFVLQASVSDTTGLSYLWQPGINLDDPSKLNPVFTPDISTTFTLSVTDINGKLLSDTVKITVSEVYADAGEDQLIEEGSTVELNGNQSIGEQLQFNWTTFNGSIISGQNTPTALVSSEGTYYLEVSDLYTCVSKDSVIVNKKNSDLPDVDAGNDTIIGSCIPFILQASVSDTLGLSYVWEPAGNLDDPNLLNPVFTQGNSTEFILTVNTTTGATVIDTVFISVSDILANAGNDLLIEENATAMLDGTASSGMEIQYLWTTNDGIIESGQNSANPIIRGPGTYYLEITDLFGCNASDSVEVSRITYAPTANDDYDTTAFQTAVTINVLANDYDPDGALDQTTLSIEQFPVNGTVYIDYNDYSITYMPAEGYIGNDVFEYRICNLSAKCDNAHVYVVVTPVDFFIPDAFTPNADNINDYFEIEGIEYYPGNTITIINRWGKHVYQARNYGIDTTPKFWDGKWTTGGGNGDLPTGTYFYVLDLGNGQNPIAGSVYIDR